jgi:uncharacterized oxidoreductase
MKISGNTILITGGTSGIGYELTKQLLALGNDIVVTGRDAQKLEKVKSELPKVGVIRSDVSSPAEIESLCKKVTTEFPSLNMLINNAGIMREINIHTVDDSLSDLTREVDINLKGPIRMIRAFLPHLKERASAAIVNVSSGLAFVPLPIAPIYCATKAALHSFSMSLRVQLKNTHVRVFEIAPPATQTELLHGMSEDDLKDVSVMRVDDMVRASLKGMERDQFEICPGQAKQLRMMNRLAPAFILRQLSKPVDRMLAK